MFAENPDMDLACILEELGFTGAEVSRIEDFAEKIIAERADFVSEKRLSAVGPLMGVVMGQFRGKADGKLVSEILKRKIEAFLNSK
jgi:glutamyl-tRNA(Gln) amidotransferase subunit E